MSGPVSPLPPAQQKMLRKAQRLQLLWLVVLATIVAAIYLASGNSQAMKTAWMEDMLSFIPPLAFLVACRFEGRPPNQYFPLGYVRVSSISYLTSSVALAGVGIFLFVDSSITLASGEQATIGSFEIFGTTLWFGWLMIAALAYSVALPVIFGRLKLKPARELHDKTLWADALMNKADWMTGLAGILGILGIGLGWWWADAVAAMVIAFSVLHDGYQHTSAAIRDLCDETPRTVDDRELEPLIEEVRDYLDSQSWLVKSHLRFREEGRYLTGSIHVVPSTAASLLEHLKKAEEDILALHWRMRAVTIMPLRELGESAATERQAAEFSPSAAPLARADRPQSR